MQKSYCAISTFAVAGIVTMPSFAALLLLAERSGAYPSLHFAR